MNDIPTYADVLAAAERIAGPAVRTPLIHSPLLSERVGGRVFLKAETLQRTGSFKFRGAYNTVKALGPEAGGIVACSSGNHAQGVAEAARLAGLPATIVMPSDAPAVKRARTEGFGARVVLYDRASEDRDEVAGTVLAEAGGAMVHPYNDPRVIAGQGTAGLEIAEDLERAGVTPEVVLVPCSGGGLTAGLTLALTEHFPEVAIYGVEPAGFDDYARSLAAGRPVRNARLAGSICDALLSPEPGPIGFAINRERLAGALSVSDEEALHAVGFAYEALRLIVEPGGAAALAALLQGRIDFAGRTVVVVLSGGNVGDEILAEAVAAYRSEAARAA
ncbi:MAG TPA: threonine/serine dehydratase [Afifellaceae bacterium]|nr:threonine/serine dehydratase [Afifellaceae bacterium]